MLPNVVCSGVVEGRVKTNNLLSSLLLLSRSEAGEVMVEGSKLIIRDMMATNGVVHLIDRVLVPTKATTLASALKARPLLSSLIETAGLSEQFASLTNATLFLPSEEAIKELPEAQLEQLKEEPQSLKDLLSFHVSQPQVHFCSQLEDFFVNILSGYFRILSSRPHKLKSTQPEGEKKLSNVSPLNPF